MYWKLYPTIWEQYRTARRLTPERSAFAFFALRLLILAKTPWWLLIKPFGQLFSIKTTYTGSIVRRNDVVSEVDVLKTCTWKLCGVPFFSYKTKTISDDEIQSLLK